MAASLAANPAIAARINAATDFDTLFLQSAVRGHHDCIKTCLLHIADINIADLVR